MHNDVLKNMLKEFVLDFRWEGKEMTLPESELATYIDKWLENWIKQQYL